MTNRFKEVNLYFQIFKGAQAWDFSEHVLLNASLYTYFLGTVQEQDSELCFQFSQEFEVFNFLFTRWLRIRGSSFYESLVRKKCLKRSTVLPFQKILLGFSKFCIFKSFRRCLLGRCWVLLLLVDSVSNKGTFFQRWLTIRRIFTCFSCPHSKHAESTQKCIKLTLSHHINLFPLRLSQHRNNFGVHWVNGEILNFLIYRQIEIFSHRSRVPCSWHHKRLICGGQKILQNYRS
jgi:hypothetical protein